MNLFKLKNIEIKRCETTKSWLNIFYENIPKILEIEDLTIPINPILVLAKNGNFELVYGFRLLKLFREKEFDVIPAYVFRENPKFTDIFTTIIAYHKQTNELNIIEICEILNLLVNKNISKEKIINNFTSLLNIPPKIEIIEQYLSLQKIGNQIIKFLLLKKAPLKKWLIFPKIDKSAQKFLEKIISKTKPSLSIFGEITRNLFETSLREEKSILEIVRELNLFIFLEEENPQKSLTKIRKTIFEARYPQITKFQRKINTERKKIDPPKNVQIIPDKTLETKKIRINCTVSSKEDIQTMRDFFNAKKNDLSSLLEKMIPN